MASPPSSQDRGKRPAWGVDERKTDGWKRFPARVRATARPYWPPSFCSPLSPLVGVLMIFFGTTLRSMGLLMTILGAVPGAVGWASGAASAYDGSVSDGWTGGACGGAFGGASLSPVK